MLNKFKINIKKYNEILALFLLIVVTIISTTFYNLNKERTLAYYKNIINNVYLKKTANHLFNNLEPKFKKVTHKVMPGESFDSILSEYSVQKSEIGRYSPCENRRA